MSLLCGDVLCKFDLCKTCIFKILIFNCRMNLKTALVVLVRNV